MTDEHLVTRGIRETGFSSSPPLDCGQVQARRPGIAFEQRIFPVGEAPRREEDDTLHRTGPVSYSHLTLPTNYSV